MPVSTTPLLEGPLVAVVDDDESVREALCDLLAVMDIRCRAFDRAEAFLITYRAGAFDCLITDVRMPGLSGLDLQDRLRRISPPLPVIFISADTSAATRARALAGGAIAFLAKPISGGALYEHLRVILKPGRSTRMDDSHHE
ncbi:response regulator [Rhodopseudomonas sp. HC1]|uniref:response regulator transcription factor n=1 Tax=Rhodopseudomonas infernalis TaxID=2897386 RepID=UPI001EE8D28D|nr:response regulator [Rhodopseudomonas infernalis]MCG6205809.1 response regulator [Rhodopseudomonas infernalis]